MKCKTPNEIILADTLTAILFDLPYLECKNFNHSRQSDRHSDDEACPIKTRFDAVVKQASEILK